MNGSRLGKEFSANKFNDLFKESHVNEELPKQEIRKESFVPSERYTEDNSINSILSISPATNYPTIDNDKVPPTSKKKKKRRYGRQM